MLAVYESVGAGMKASKPSDPPWLIAHSVVQVVVIALGCTPARDPDLGFHLATGRAVLALGRVPKTNLLSFAEPAADAINQQWLPAVLFELSYRALGIAGPTLLKTLLLSVTFAVVLDMSRVLGARAYAGALVTVLAVWASAPRFGERPLLFSNLCIVIVAYCIALRYAGRHAARLPVAPYLTAGLATALAVHLHAGAVFAFALLIVVAAANFAACIPWLRALAPEPQRAPALEGSAWIACATLAFGLAAFALSLYHPHGIKVLTVPFAMASDPFLYSVLVEFRPPWAFDFEILAAYWSLCLLALIALAAMVWHRSLTITATMAFGLALSLRHSRFVDLACALAAPGLALALTSIAAASHDSRRVERAFGVLTGCAVFCVLTLVASTGRFGFGYEPSTWPVSLMRDARSLGLSGPAFVQDGWAGPYLAFRYPRERVFFHPAFDAYSQHFFREVYMRTRDGESGWDDALDRHGVRLVLMKHTSPNERKRQQGRPNLRQRLVHDERWALLSFDAYGLLFARRSSLGSVARAAVIEGFDPDRAAFFLHPSNARAGLSQLGARGMQSRLLEHAQIAAMHSR